jgi:hypothetical protein
MPINGSKCRISLDSILMTNIKVTSLTATILGLVWLASLAAAAQSADVSSQGKETSADRTKQPVAPVSLEVKSTIHVANLYASELNDPAVCGPDDRLYATVFVVRPNAPPGHLMSHNLIGIDRDGRTSLKIGTENITDIQNARWVSFFPTESEIYVLVRAPKDDDPEHAKPRPGGVEALFQKSEHEREFIVRFDRDGTYRGKTRIDIPISGLQLGVFPNGQFLIAGIDELNHARVVLVKASGQLDRYVELKNLHDNDPSAANAAEPPIGERLAAAVFSRLIANGNEMLLSSRDSSSLFKINATGEAQEVRLPAEANIVQSVPAGWLAESSDSKHGVLARLYSPADGSLIREYVFADKRDLVFGCMSDEEVTFLRKDTDGRLLLIVTSRSSKQGKDDTRRSTNY